MRIPQYLAPLTVSIIERMFSMEASDEIYTGAGFIIGTMGIGFVAIIQGWLFKKLEDKND